MYVFRFVFYIFESSYRYLLVHKKFLQNINYSIFELNKWILSPYSISHIFNINILFFVGVKVSQREEQGLKINSKRSTYFFWNSRASFELFLTNNTYNGTPHFPLNFSKFQVHIIHNNNNIESFNTTYLFVDVKTKAG